MDHRERESALFQAIKDGNWNAAIEHATHMPPNHDPWQRMPSAAPMPDDAARKVIETLTHPYGHHNKNLPSFMYEYGNNLPEHASNEWLNELAKLHLKHNSPDVYLEQNILNHPNFKADEDIRSLQRAVGFWKGYEKKVDPMHFATIKSMYTGKPEVIKDHRGNSASSDQSVHLLPDLKNHTKAVQAAIMKDDDIPKRMFAGQPHIQLFRGVNGHYGKLIRNAANYNQQTNEADKKTFSLPTSHLASWSLDPNIAGNFAWSRSDIKDQPADQGVVLSKWVPVSSAIHSGIHNTVIGQMPVHPHEQEIVIGHPEGKMRISTSDMRFQSKPKEKGSYIENYGNTDYPVFRKSEELAKGAKGKMASAMTALAMLGAPQLDSVDPTSINDYNPPHIQKEHDRAAASIPNENLADVNPGLLPIQMIESSGGSNTNHPMIEEGPQAGTRAYGKYGLMPMQIIDTVNHDPLLGSKHSDIASMDYKADQEKIFRTLKRFPELEKQIANSHWKRLGDRFDGNQDRMAYAWLNGITGATRASDEDILNHPYVQKYRKYKQLLNLEQSHQPVHKSEKESHPDLHGVEKFIPLTGTKADGRSINVINQSIKSGNVHNVSNVGHFTHDSFIAGFDRDDSWLIKVEPKAKSAIKSARYGLQAVKEVAFYKAAEEVFDLGQYTPKAILGEIVRHGEMHPAAAIKMYPGAFVSASHFEKAKPGSMRGILDKYRRNGTMHKWAAMLYILGDADAHGNNVLTNGEHVKLIDHGTSFADVSFDPGSDKKIFIPFILRGGYIKEHMTPHNKLQLMPKIKSEHVEREFKHWLMNLDTHRLMGILDQFYIDPRPTLSRLKLVQKLVSQSDKPDEVINHLWVMGFHLGEEVQ